MRERTPEKIKPCPYCSSSASLHITPMEYWRICCSSDSCRLSGPLKVTTWEAVEAWNSLLRKEEKNA